MASSVLPSAKGLYLCDYHVGYENGKVDLYGLFNAIQPASYPHVQQQFCVFAQLANGLVRIPFFVDIRYAPRDELIYTSARNVLVFPNRTSVVQVALAIRGCKFDRPGMYFIELFCDNTWMCDATLLLEPPVGENHDS
jgi:hypothetical protein